MAKEETKKKPAEKKKAPAKKAAPKKPAAKKAAPKKSAEKKPAAKKTTEKKAAPKKPAAKKAPAKKAPEPKTETYSSDNISLTVNKKPGCKVEFVVHAKPQMCAQAKKDGLKALAKEVSIPGFRKGKAPVNMLEKKFPKAVEDEMMKKLANAAYSEAQSLANCPLLNNNSQISYDLLTRDASVGIDMSFTFESEPDIPEIDFSIIDFKDAKKGKVDAKKIDETIDQIRSFYATHDVAKERAAKKGDFVVIDIDDMDFDPPSNVFKAQRFELSDKGMAEWMFELVSGMKPGEEKEGVSRANSDDSDQIKEQFKPKKVRVKLIEIQEQVLPAIDDELAKKVGVTSVKEMKERLKVLLTQRSEQEYQEELRSCVSKSLLEKLVFDIPQTIKEKEFSHRFKHALQNEHFKKEWDKKNAADKEAYQRQLMQEADDAIKLFYLSREIARRYNVKVERPSDQPNPTNVLDAMFTDREMLHFDTKSEDEQAYLMSKLLLRKAQDFAIEKAQKA